MFRSGRLARVLLVPLAVCAAACQKQDGRASGETVKLRFVLQSAASADGATAPAALERSLEALLPGTDVDVTTVASATDAATSLRVGASAAIVEPLAATHASGEGAADVALAEAREVMIEEQADERTSFFSYWIVPEDSPYQYLRDLQGKRVALPDGSSAAGYVFPVARLVELGLLDRANGWTADARLFFGDVVFARDYAEAYESLRRKQVDAIVIAGDAPEELYRRALDSSRILEQQGPVPTNVVLFGRNLGEPLRSRLKNALLELGRPVRRDEARLIFGGRFAGFEEADDSHLQSLRRALDQSGLRPAQAGV